MINISNKHHKKKIYIYIIMIVNLYGHLFRKLLLTNKRKTRIFIE